MKNFKIPRRSFLRGAGVSLLLPSLDIMLPEKAAAATLPSPRYAAFCLVGSLYGQKLDMSKNDVSRYSKDMPDEGNGATAWLPRTGGALPANLPRLLQPLNAHKSQLTVIGGLSALPGDDGAEHSLAAASWLTCGWSSAAEAIQKWSGTNTRKSDAPPTSIDQTIAELMGFTTGSSIAFHGHLSGSANGGSESKGGHPGVISYNAKLGGSRVVPKSTDPLAVFNKLFSDCTTGTSVGTQTLTQEQLNHRSMLDRVLASITSLKPKLGQDDKHRLDSYLTYVEDLQKRLTKPPPPPSDWCPDNLPSLNSTWHNKINLMVDVIAYALATDAMPVATLMPAVEVFNNTGITISNEVAALGNYQGINGQVAKLPTILTDLHLSIIHKARIVKGGGNLQEIEQYLTYNLMMMGFVKRLMDKMESFPTEPNGKKPLDNSIIFVGAPHADGPHHYNRNAPAFLLGGSSFGLKKNATIKLPKTHLGNLHYSVIKALGFNINNFNGNGTYLGELFV